MLCLPRHLSGRSSLCILLRRAVYGSAVAKHLLQFEQTVGSGAAPPPPEADADAPHFSVKVCTVPASSL